MGTQRCPRGRFWGRGYVFGPDTHSDGEARLLCQVRQPLVGEIVLFVAVLANANRIAAGEKGSTGGAADRLGIEVGEPHPLAGHPVDAGSLEVGGPKNAKVAVALVVGKDNDEVRFLLGLFRGR